MGYDRVPDRLRTCLSTARDGRMIRQSIHTEASAHSMYRLRRIVSRCCSRCRSHHAYSSGSLSARARRREHILVALYNMLDLVGWNEGAGKSIEELYPLLRERFWRRLDYVFRDT